MEPDPYGHVQRARDKLKDALLHVIGCMSPADAREICEVVESALAELDRQKLIEHDDGMYSLTFDGAKRVDGRE